MEKSFQSEFILNYIEKCTSFQVILFCEGVEKFDRVVYNKKMP